MVLSNTENVPGRQIVEFYGVVTGSTVRAKHIGRDIMASLKNSTIVAAKKVAMKKTNA